jgi:hypothetical protein
MEQRRRMALVCATTVAIAAAGYASAQTGGKAFDDAPAKQAQQYLADGKKIPLRHIRQRGILGREAQAP